MAHFGHFWANFMHVMHKANFVFFCTKPEKYLFLANLELNFGEQSSGELCGQENKANAKLIKKRVAVCLATGELIA